LAGEEDELALREFRVDKGERYGMEREIPCGEPGVLPRVGHRDYVGAVELAPVGIAAEMPVGRRRWFGRVAVEPATDVDVVVLLAPDQAGERLPLDESLVV